MLDTSSCHPLCQCDKCLKINRAKSVKVDASSATAEGQTALHVAALHGVPDVARMLLEEGVSCLFFLSLLHTYIYIYIYIARIRRTKTKDSNDRTRH